MMKKFLALVMAAVMLASVASAATVEPCHGLVSEWPDEDYGEESEVLFDVEKDIDGTNVTYTEYNLDEYKREEIEKLQPGDTILTFGEEVTVETIEKTDDEYIINGGFDMDGVTLCVSEEDNDVFYSLSYDDILSHTAGEVRTLPMADQVRVGTYKMGEDGNYHGDMDVEIMPASEVKDYLLNKGVSLDGSHTIYVKDGKITEIDIEWSPNV